MKKSIKITVHQTKHKRSQRITNYCHTHIVHH